MHFASQKGSLRGIGASHRGHSQRQNWPALARAHSISGQNVSSSDKQRDSSTKGNGIFIAPRKNRDGLLPQQRVVTRCQGQDQPAPGQNTVLTLPTALTLGRVVAIPALVVMWFAQGWTSCFLLFIGASITDFLDGYLARRMVCCHWQC